MNRGATLGLALALALGCRNAKPAPPPPSVVAATVDASAPARGGGPDPAQIAIHLAELAGPALRGRGGGTPDEAAAADRIAGWLRAAGVEPAGDVGYLTGFDYPGGHSQNVVGIIRGKRADGGHVVIGAHYDHLGAVGDTIYYGADDNASGTAGLVAIATALTHDGRRPDRTVVIVGFGAEEAGLHGSAAYVAHPALPIDETIAMINLDMIGRPRFLSASAYGLVHALVPDDAIGALATQGYPGLVALARTGAHAVGRPLVAASDFGALEASIRPLVELRGDQASFAAVGVPYLWLSTSMHDDYHLPTDTVDKVDPATIAAVASIVIAVVTAMPERAALTHEPATD